MKNIIIAFALFFATSATSFASDKIVLQFATTLSSDDQGTVWGVVRVLENETMTIEKWIYNWSTRFVPLYLGTVTTVLKPLVAERLVSNIVRLSDADIVSTRSDVVCMMMLMPGPSRALSIATGYDYNTRKFSGDLRIVETNSGCWDFEHTSPKYEHDRILAATVMGALEILSIELSN